MAGIRKNPPSPPASTQQASYKRTKGETSPLPSNEQIPAGGQPIALLGAEARLINRSEAGAVVLLPHSLLALLRSMPAPAGLERSQPRATSHTPPPESEGVAAPQGAAAYRSYCVGELSLKDEQVGLLFELIHPYAPESWLDITQQLLYVAGVQRPAPPGRDVATQWESFCQGFAQPQKEIEKFLANLPALIALPQWVHVGLQRIAFGYTSEEIGDYLRLTTFLVNEIYVDALPTLVPIDATTAAMHLTNKEDAAAELLRIAQQIAVHNSDPILREAFYLLLENNLLHLKTYLFLGDKDAISIIGFVARADSEALSWEDKEKFCLQSTRVLSLLNTALGPKSDGTVLPPPSFRPIVEELQHMIAQLEISERTPQGLARVQAVPTLLWFELGKNKRWLRKVDPQYAAGLNLGDLQLPHGIRLRRLLFVSFHLLSPSVAQHPAANFALLRDLFFALKRPDSYPLVDNLGQISSLHPCIMAALSALVAAAAASLVNLEMDYQQLQMLSYKAHLPGQKQSPLDWIPEILAQMKTTGVSLDASDRDIATRRQMILERLREYGVPLEKKSTKKASAQAPVLGDVAAIIKAMSAKSSGLVTHLDAGLLQRIEQGALLTSLEKTRQQLDGLTKQFNRHQPPVVVLSQLTSLRDLLTQLPALTAQQRLDKGATYSALRSAASRFHPDTLGRMGELSTTQRAACVGVFQLLASAMTLLSDIPAASFTVLMKP